MLKCSIVSSAPSLGPRTSCRISCAFRSQLCCILPRTRSCETLYQPPCWEVGENSHLPVSLPDRKTLPEEMTPPRSSCPQLLGAHSGTGFVGIFLETIHRKKKRRPVLQEAMGPEGRKMPLGDQERAPVSHCVRKMRTARGDGLYSGL